MELQYWAKIGKGLLLAMGGAGCVYLLGVLNTIDVNILDPILVALFSALLNTLKVWIQAKNDKRNKKAPA